MGTAESESELFSRNLTRSLSRGAAGAESSLTHSALCTLCPHKSARCTAKTPPGGKCRFSTMTPQPPPAPQPIPPQPHLPPPPPTTTPPLPPPLTRSPSPDLDYPIVIIIPPHRRQYVPRILRTVIGHLDPAVSPAPHDVPHQLPPLCAWTLNLPPSAARRQ